MAIPRPSPRRATFGSPSILMGVTEHNTDRSPPDTVPTAHWRREMRAAHGAPALLVQDGRRRGFASQPGPQDYLHHGVQQNGGQPADRDLQPPVEPDGKESGR